MSEFDKTQRILNTIRIHQPETAQVSDDRERILISGESRYQPMLVKAYLQNKRCGRIVLTGNADAYRDLPNTTIICNRPGSRNYYPFHGHTQLEIEDMLRSLIPLVRNPTDGLDGLLKYFSRMMMLDPNLIDAIVRNDCCITTDLFEERLDLMVQRGRISERDGENLFRKLRSCTTDYTALQKMLNALTRMSANASTGIGLHVTRSLKGILEAGGCVVFEFDGNIDAQDFYDRTILSLLPTDLQLLCTNNQHSFAIVFDNLPWIYFRPFRWILGKKVSCLVHLMEFVEYANPGEASDCFGNQFARYLIFKHSSDETCTYWSNFLGKGRLIEYTYSGGNTITTRYPLSQALNFLYGSEQHNEGMSYHYVDRNIYQSYDIKNQQDFVFMCFDKRTNNVFQNTLENLR